MHQFDKAVTVIVILGCSFSVPMARADDFRISTKVFSGQNQPALAKNETIFYGDKVYDFARQFRSITVFDLTTRQFVLADLDRQMKTTIRDRDLMGIVVGMTEKAKNSARATKLMKFAAAPQFDQEITNGRISLRSDIMTYNARSQTAPDDVLIKYEIFSDWYARLNAVTRLLADPARAVPPNARLRLNAVLAKQRQIPIEVQLSIKFDGQRPTLLRSEHELFQSLEPDDLVRINSANREIGRLTEETLQAYCDSKLAQRAGARNR